MPVKKPKATWVRPIVDAEIEYGALTDGLLREAVFKGLRDDLALPAAHAPPVASDRWQRNHKGRGAVPRENILQLLPDAVPPSKEQLAAYWRNVAKHALPYLGRRPLKLVRHTRSTTFYHKGALPPIPDAVHQLRIEKRKGGEGMWVWVDSLAGLLGLVEMDVVEVHPWAATVDDIEHPDVLVTAPDRYTTSSAPAKRNRRILYRQSAQRPRHDGGRRLFPTRAGGISDRRAGDLGTDRARYPSGCV